MGLKLNLDQELNEHDGAVVKIVAALTGNRKCKSHVIVGYPLTARLQRVSLVSLSSFSLFVTQCRH